MPDKVQKAESTAEAMERRAGPRFRASSLIYVELGNGNGGIVTCINESGLALTAAVTLEDGKPEDELLKMRIQLPGIEGGIETGGQIVWKSASRKEAALRFVDLEKGAREEIRKWISAQKPNKGLPAAEPVLPDIELPRSKEKKGGGPEFSFADVASSLVDGEEDTKAVDLPGTVAGPETFPSDALEGEPLANLAQAVSFAFESPSLAEEQNKEASEQVRLKIREWVSTEEGSVEFHRGENEALRGSLPVPDGSVFEGQEGLSSEPAQSKPRFKEQPGTQVSAPIRPALFASSVKGVFARSWVRKRVARIKPPRGPKDSVKQRRRLARNALASAALVAMVVAGWNLQQRGSSNVASGTVSRNIPKNAAPNESVQTSAATSGFNTVGRAVARAQAAEPPAPLTKEEAPHANAQAAATPRVNTEIVRALKKNAQGNERTERVSAANPASRKANPPERNMPSPREEKARTLQRIAPDTPQRLEKKSIESQFVANRAAENTPVQTAQVARAQNKELNALPPLMSPPPVHTEAIHGEAAPAVEAKEERPLAAARPPESPAARMGIVSVSLDPYPSIRLPKSENAKKSRQGKSLQMGHLLTRVDPVYPEDAKQQGIEGTVKVHAIFDGEGTVQSLISVSGPQLLVPAAMNAVRQWRYSPTILAGQHMETEEDVTVLFRLSNGASRN